MIRLPQLRLSELPLGVWILLGVSLWAAVLGWLVSPYLELYGLVVALVLIICLAENWRKRD